MVWLENYVCSMCADEQKLFSNGISLADIVKEHSRPCVVIQDYSDEIYICKEHLVKLTHMLEGEACE